MKVNDVSEKIAKKIIVTFLTDENTINYLEWFTKTKYEE